MSTLFDIEGLSKDTGRPLADRLRPSRLDEVLGQDHILREGAPLNRMYSACQLTSFILWGPPGTGKTTIARLLAKHVELEFQQLSAVFSGVADLKKVFASAEARRLSGRSTVLFVDEIHRFNRSQQDSFLAVVEEGTIVLIGATTQNPSFELNSALLSRCKVFEVNRLRDQDLEVLVSRAEISAGRELPLDNHARIALRMMADGDGRYLLNLVETLLQLPEDTVLNRESLAAIVQERVPLYDKSGDEHHKLVSALHKSLRGSDPDASLYWLARMLLGGENPLYIIRRLVRFAAEDIGLADPHALQHAIAAKDTYEFLGSPEGELAIAQLVIYLATASKSNAIYKALLAGKESARESGSLSPPHHILNAPTQMMKSLGYGRGYVYDHDTEERFSGQNYFPEGVKPVRFYQPSDQGFEREVSKRITYWANLREELTEEE